MRIAFAAICLVSLFSIPATRASERSVEEAACDRLQQRVTGLLKAGDQRQAQALRPQLTRCLDLAQGRLDREARDLVTRHQEIVGEPATAR